MRNARRPERAVISVYWPDDWHEIRLTPRNWSRVRAGKALRIRGKGYYYEGEFFWDFWDFSGGVDGDLTVNYGNEGDYSGVGWTGPLRFAEIDTDDAGTNTVREAEEGS
jgi:hypothetical protein